MGFNSTANPFVALVNTKPDLILRGSRVGFSAELYAHIQMRMKEFSQVYLEIGSGSGGHLIAHAQRKPDALFIGIELRYKRVYKTAEKADRLGLKNVLVLQIDALMIPKIFTTESLDGIYVLFPDPWEKRRWHKHRIMNEKFIGVMHALLKSGGFLHYKTDHGEYFEATVKVLEKLAFFTTSRLSRDLHQELEQLENVESEFEKLFKSKQLPVHLLEAVKPFTCKKNEPVL